MLEVAFPGAGQGYAARRTVEEPRPETLFQRIDLARNRRRSDPHAPGGRRKTAAAFDDCHECLQSRERVHDPSLRKMQRSSPIMTDYRVQRYGLHWRQLERQHAHL